MYVFVCVLAYCFDLKKAWFTNRERLWQTMAISLKRKCCLKKIMKNYKVNEFLPQTLIF